MLARFVAWFLSGDQVTHTELRSAVESEVKQRMTAYALQVNLTSEDMRIVKWTLFGNKDAGETGLVADVSAINDTLKKILHKSERRDYVTYGMAAGIALNLAEQTGWLATIVHALQAVARAALVSGRAIGWL